MPEQKPKKETTQKTPKTTRSAQTSDNVVFIGKKPAMNYVIACLIFFNSGAKRVVVKARGRAISRAVDTIEVLRRTFVRDLQLQGIALSTEEVTRSEGQKAKVSAIEIRVTKQ
jgi:DNA-binding protein